ncbi:glycogen debranching N-terminal domain-containing protein [Sorangium sp. So ce448]|uniref:amylo-alpha-1,6-glucosidase n=1 Tax=Sorangium sp. So ce448 TaxID=3133314 RepID=UPI003F613C6C
MAERSPGERQERKERVLTQGTSSMAQSIADAIVLKQGGVFLLTEQSGAIPLRGAHGFGLYYHDCRFLNGYTIELDGARPEALAATAEAGHTGVFQLANPRTRMRDGHIMSQHEVGLRWERVIDGDATAVYEDITVHNHARSAVDLELTFTFRAEFEDVYAVRGLLPEALGELRAPTWDAGELRFTYDGADDLQRAVTIRWGLRPDATDGTSARFRVRLPPGGSQQIPLVITLSESSGAAPAAERAPASSGVDVAAVKRRVDERIAAQAAEQASVETDSLLVNRVLSRSFDDLRVLRTPLDHDVFFAAGVPWFTTLFGRDSLITALEVLPYRRAVAVDTLRLLAQFQARERDPWRDEQPGKILHELRVGELARVGEIPQTPYYGTVDATALFLILLARHAAWAGRLDVFRELRGNVDAALAWLSSPDAHPDIDGYLAYDSTSTSGLVNQGWKDSGDAIVDEEGRIAAPPIALVEVQAYVYLAKSGIADLFERAGEPETAARLRREAADLQQRFERDFWLPERGIYALALMDGGRRAAVCSSNAGHALWAGIAEPSRARRCAERLMSESMYSGWGIRTLAADEKAYNPMSYHRGTVWPHDNALIVAGLRRYGLDREARTVFGGIVSAAMRYRMHRLPELFCGFPRAEHGAPVRYPVACHPQAWAAGAVPYMLASLLGLEPEGFDRRLRVVRPILPRLVRRATVRGLAVADGRVDLEFRRRRGGAVDVDVLRVEGDVDVVVEER